MKKNLVKSLLIGGILASAFATTLSISNSSVYASSITTIEKYKYNDYDVYYSDSYFNNSAKVFNEHLATASGHAANFSSPAGEIKKNYTEAQKNNWYKSQPEKIKGFYNTLGFTTFDSNEDYKKATAFDTIGVACASKEIQNGDYTLVALTIRSGNYFREWGNNTFLGDGTKSDYMHEGWYNAANKAISFLGDYINTYDISGKIKLWINGYSRGGATANLIAGLLDNELDQGKQPFANTTLTFDDLYAYTIEAPQGANINSKTVKHPKDEIYNNIWNIVNPNDLVTKVAMSEWGFTRFGQDKFITTKFYDPNNYNENLRTFKAFYVDKLHQKWNEYKADTFKMYGMPIENATLQLLKMDALVLGIKLDYDFIKEDNRKANYDSNIVSTLFLEELVNNIGSRENYHKNLEKGVCNLLTYFMDDVEGKQGEKFDDAKNKLIISVVVGSIVAGATGSPLVAGTVINLISNSDPAIKITKDMLFPLLKAIGATYWERPNELISMAKQASNIFQNHDLDLIIAHIEAQDSYYVTDYNSSNPNNRISLVPLMDNADFVRFKFFGFNDLGLRIGNLNAPLVVNVDGHIFDKSDVLGCKSGYAVGYYSYLTEEKMELFMANTNAKYTVTMKSYSKKPKHLVKYDAYYQFISLEKHNKIRETIGGYEKTVRLNSDRIIDESSMSALEMLNFIDNLRKM